MFLGAGRCWVDYDDRLTKALRALVREEYRRRSDEEAGQAEEEKEESPQDDEY
ncbi:hypothetical protein P3342_000865 [Pyrenophora teres f. teres]|nr:hypothetical protein P3342_000865 [Pyrenophora teres f. teres]